MRWLGVALAIAGLLACGSGKKRQSRTHDGGAVEPIATPNFGTDGGTAKTTAADEIEPNDNDDVAMPLPLAGTIHGRIDPESDADYYRIEVATAGALAIEVSAVDNTDLTLEVKDPTGTTIAKSDRGAAKTKEGVPNVGVQPGRYIAIVRTKKIPVKGKAPKKPATPPPALPYDITAQVAPVASHAEREPDDDRGTANDLIVGDPMSGYIGWTGDTDVWKLSIETLSAKNVIDIEIGSVEGVAFGLEIADGVGQVLAQRKAPRGAGLVVRGLLPVVAAGSPPFHYLTIKGTPSNHESPYSLRVTARNPEPDAEVEPNDTLEKPMAIPSDRTVVNGQWTPGDIDCFAVAPDVAARTLDVTVDVPPEADLSVELVVDGKVAAKSDVKGKGAAEKVSAPVPSNGRAVVRVRGADSGAEGAYEIKVTEGPPEKAH
ncbi:MAG: hypothetical protein ABI867_43355 [Kofleriaceae bacterium]